MLSLFRCRHRHRRAAVPPHSTVLRSTAATTIGCRQFTHSEWFCDVPIRVSPTSAVNFDATTSMTGFRSGSCGVDKRLRCRIPRGNIQDNNECPSIAISSFQNPFTLTLALAFCLSLAVSPCYSLSFARSLLGPLVRSIDRSIDR